MLVSPWWIVLVLLTVGLLLWGIWPKVGLLARWQQAQLFTQRVRVEDTLKAILHMQSDGMPVTLEGLAGSLQVSTNEITTLIEEMQQKKLVSWVENHYQLTPAGHELAIHIVRAHRLWERHLADRTGYDVSEWHSRAEKMEHHLSPEEVVALERKLGYPSHDPHGDPIPFSGGTLQALPGHPLTQAQAETDYQIVHIEDEPEAIYKRLLRANLFPSMRIHVQEVSPEGVRICVGGEEMSFSPLEAANLSVLPVPSDEAKAGIPSEQWERLSALKAGERATLLKLGSAIRGLERRRLMDFGLVPGTLLEVELQSPSGDPTAYRVRGKLIALREAQTQQIFIQRA
ncbi:MAG: FeoA domain-containing protein [Myxococcales bacterium]|nr:FeoA domain-containing protein [Myxococcales bacterium]